MTIDQIIALTSLGVATFSALITWRDSKLNKAEESPPFNTNNLNIENSHHLNITVNQTAHSKSSISKKRKKKKIRILFHSVDGRFFYRFINSIFV